MADVIDLGVLMPQSRYITYPDIEGEIEIKPPDTGHVLIMGAMSDKLSRKSDLSDDEIKEASERMTRAIKECIPELMDKDLPSAIVDQLFFILSEMALPAKAPELEERGLDQADPKAQ